MLSGRLLRSTATVGLNTLVSRVLGLVRDVVIARLFGATAEVDAFLVAFRIPNLLRRFFAEGAFSQAFVPVLSEFKTNQPHAAVRDLVSHVFGVLGGALFLVSAAGVVAAPILVLVFAPGFLADQAKFDLTLAMVRITFPYILFISLTAFAAGILNTYGKFGVPAFTPVLLNLSLIGCALWLAPHLARPVVALACGVFLAGLVQLGFQLPFLRRLRLLVRPRFDVAHAGVRRIVRLVVPAVFGVSVSQINLLIDTLIASFLVSGSITWLYYSDRMIEFPLGVFGVALATVILPSLSQQHARGSPALFSETLDWALRLTLLIILPAALALAVLAGPVLSTLFQYGEFGPHDVEMARLSLMAYACGLLGFVGVKILAPGFYARQDTRTPVRIGVIAMLTNIVLNLALVVPLAHAGLALATALAALLNAGLLLASLRRTAVYRPAPGWPGFIVRLLAANAVMGAFLLIARGDLARWLGATLAERAAWLVMLIGSGAVVYFMVLLVSGIRPAQFTARK